MAKGPVDIGKENTALGQEGMTSSQGTTEPNRQPCDKKAAETEATRLKGQEARRRSYEERMEKQRPTALTAEEQRLKQRRRDEGFMGEAPCQAKKAAAIGDVPIGCVIICGNRIMARGHNRCSADKSMLLHAGTISIKKACKKMGDRCLEDYTMYVTLEPCPMRAGAIMRARTPRTTVGCVNPKAGCAGSALDIFRVPGFNHQAEMMERVLEQECSKLMSDLFQNLREHKK